MFDWKAVVLLLAHFTCRVSNISPELKSRRTNRVLLSELVRLHGATSLAHKMPAYDGSRSLYIASELPFKSMDFVVKLGRQEM